MSLNLILIVLAGVSFFATAITEEKEEGTLALLRLAGLNPVGLLLGKSTSRLIGTLLLLAIQLPFTLLAVTLGGATLEQILAGYASLAAFLVLTANLGLLASVIAPRGGTASILTGLLLLLVLFGSRLATMLLAPVLAAGGTGSTWLGRLLELTGQISPLTRLDEVLNNTFSGGILGLQVGLNLLLGGGAFLLAWSSFARFNRPGRPVEIGADWMTRITQLLGNRRPRPRWRSIMWKEFHFVTGGTRFLLARFLVYLALISAIFLIGQRYLRQPLDSVANSALLTMLVLVVGESCLYASRLLHDEWRERTLPSLMMLPVSPAQILGDKLLGCVPALIPGLLALALTALVSELGREYLLELWLPSRLCAVFLFGLLLTLTLFFSLVVRWGALPLALAVMSIGLAMASCPLSVLLRIGQSNSSVDLSGEIGFLIVDVIILFLIGGLQFDIVRRLEIAASQ